MGDGKLHSLVDKVYKRKNLEVAREKVKKNRGAGGIDGEDLAAFEARLEANLERLHRELKEATYQPQAVLQRLIPKAGQPGKHRPLGIPTIYDRGCQQAMVNRLAPIFEPVFDGANFGYRSGRSTKDALRKVWRELEQGKEWVVDADLKDFFGPVDHDRLLALVNQRVSDGRVLGLIKQFLEAGCVAERKWLATEQGVVSPILANIYLHDVLDLWAHAWRGKNSSGDVIVIRYADDIVLGFQQQHEARAFLQDLRERMRNTKSR